MNIDTIFVIIFGVFFAFCIVMMVYHAIQGGRPIQTEAERKAEAEAWAKIWESFSRKK